MGRDTVSVISERDCLRKTRADPYNAPAGRIRTWFYTVSEEIFSVISSGKETYSFPGVPAIVKDGE